MCRAVLKTTMEKRAAAICCLFITILLLSGQQQQVAAKAGAKFCRCYVDCYNKCRSQSNKSMCGFVCFSTCPIDAGSSVITPRSDRDIYQQLSICGMAAD
jgi:hypothetical protein